MFPNAFYILCTAEMFHPLTSAAIFVALKNITSMFVMLDTSHASMPSPAKRGVRAATYGGDVIPQNANRNVHLHCVYLYLVCRQKKGTDAAVHPIGRMDPKLQHFLPMCRRVTAAPPRPRPT